jgi:restriction system protein
MSIPDYESIMLPLLKYSGDGNPHSVGDAIEALSKEFCLTQTEKEKLLPSGKQEVFNNRVGWARTYLKKAGLLVATGRGYISITPRGIEVLKEKNSSIDQKYLTRFAEFREFKLLHKEKTTEKRENTQFGSVTPKEQIEYAFEQINEELEVDLLQQLKGVTATRFEHIVIDLLVGMGYGGNRIDAAKAIGGSGDEGLDGVIDEDKLGVNRIYIQAKRWGDKNVRHSDIRNFIGSLDVAHADKGVFITTSDFSDDAIQAAQKSSKKIVTINGIRLAKLMIEHDIGVSREDEFIMKRLDTDYFVD